METITNDTNANMNDYLMSIDPIGNYLMFSPHLHRCTLTPAILDAILESGSLGPTRTIHKDDIRTVTGNRKTHNWTPRGHLSGRCLKCNKLVRGGMKCCGNIVINDAMFEKAKKSAIEKAISDFGWKCMLKASAMKDKAEAKIETYRKAAQCWKCGPPKASNMNMKSVEKNYFGQVPPFL